MPGSTAAGPARPAGAAEFPGGAATPDVAALFLRAEQTGLRLAITCRIGALVLLGAWLLLSRADDPARLSGYAIALAVFAALGLLHRSLIGSRLDRPWVKYGFVTLDVGIVSALVATQPLYHSAADLPSVFIFRAPFFSYYYVFLGVAALSFSPGLVLWTGVVGA